MVKIKGYDVKNAIYESEKTVVYRATRQQDDVPIVIKMLKTEHPTHQEVEQFQYEYKIAKKLEIPGVVKPYTFGTIGHRKIIIMEDFGGISLFNYLDSQRIGIEEKLEIAIAVAKSIAAIHKSNVIHKDIKPHNILINTETKEVKIIDFSIAAEVQRETQSIVNVENLEGTLAYISPEQTGRMNRSIDFRSDLYSFGITLYEMFVGNVPFSSKDQMELVHCHIAVMPVAPYKSNLAIPLILSDIVMKLLSKTAEDRYQGAHGLIHDLEKCYSQLKNQGKIEEFEIGEKDISGKFQIFEKLYGREKEIEHLMTVFNRASSGYRELVFYKGASGIGKSALIHEVQKPIVEKRGFFIAGKYDQFKKNIPYTAIAQAFQEFAKQLLTENEEELSKWKKLILKAVGNNGEVIIDIVPEMELIIGEQPPVQDLPAAEMLNRFNMVFLGFIKIFATKNHPLVLFLDDLQWIDSASLQLLEVLLTNPDLNYLLFIGAYRDNEVEIGHPLLEMLKNLKTEGEVWEDNTVASLAKEDINQLLSDSLHCDVSKTETFAGLIHQKTNGNPFFVTEFLKTLYSDGLIEFKEEWTWDLEKIKHAGITDNVIELMADKIKRLPEVTLNIIKIAACIGVKFSLDILLLLTDEEKEKDEIIDDLKDAVNEGIVMKSDDNIKFVHEKILAAVYSLFDESEREKIHYKIGKLLLSQAKQENAVEDRIFDIVSQLNYARELVEPANRRELLELNIDAAQKARASSAYFAALEFLKNGRELLPENSWETDYDITLLFYTELAEAEYLVTNFQEAKTLCEEVLENAKSLMDKFKIYILEIEYYHSRLEYDKELEVILKVLEELGVKLPKNPGELSALPAIIKAKIKMLNKKIEDIFNSPDITDSKKIAIMDLIVRCGEVSYFAFPNLLGVTVMRGVNMLLKEGNAATAAIIYAGYAIILAWILGDFDSGYKFAKLALKIAEKFDIKSIQGKVYNTSTFLFHLKEPLKNNIKYYKKGIQCSLDAGDFLTASWMYLHYPAGHFLCGDNLKKVEKIFEECTKNIMKLKQQNTSFLLWKHVALNLLGQSEDRIVMKSETFDEDEALKLFSNANDLNGLGLFYTAKTILCFLQDEPETALEFAKKGEEYIEGILGLQYFPVYYFYYALSLFVVHSTVDKNEKNKNLKKINEILKKFKKWGDANKYNYLHKYKLLSAELAQLKGKTKEAAKLYDEAIKVANKNSFIQEEAVANECAAKFYIDQDDDEKASKYMTEAYYCFRSWGAAPKLRYLEDTYEQLIKMEVRQPSLNSDATTVTSVTTSGAVTTTKSEFLDLSTIVKASQAIAGEIVLSKLLEKMIRLAIENAGAQKGMLLLENNGTLLIEAKGDVESDTVRVMESIPVSAEEIPESIINYVARSKKEILLNDAMNDPMFGSDPYIKRIKPKSILCGPILDQGEMSGILYIENDLTVGAFTPGRMQLLSIISSQAAVSIDNARLYASLEQKVEERTAELRETRDALWGEMQLAKKIQTVLVPQEPVMENYEVAASMDTADEVGGDYYDVINAGDRDWLVIGDVSGHGVPAGLIMMMAQSTIHVAIDENPNLPPSEVLSIINKTITRNIKQLGESKYMTMTVLALKEDGEFIYSGLHQDILIYRAETGEVDQCETNGMWIGLIDDISDMLTNDSLTMRPGDAMLLYTDGITEAWLRGSVKDERNPEMEMYGDDQLVETFKQLGKGSAEEIRTGILDSLREYDFADDVTMVAVKRLK
ncbi:MAG: AAA family ATPase [bacterium]|nr:AAA family ATPase [bacterium]